MILSGLNFPVECERATKILRECAGESQVLRFEVGESSIAIAGIEIKHAFHDAVMKDRKTENCHNFVADIRLACAVHGRQRNRIERTQKRSRWPFPIEFAVNL